ncbi:MAG: nucleotidyltransferase family protein [Anaerolineae bacterium]|nr:nucleotidyltransferase family protein [Anaerolineae bacterium]
MKALILAGGLGTRLRSRVSDRPKPLAQVGDRPFLAYQIAQLREQGIREIVLCVSYLADHIQAVFGDGSGWGVHIAYALETTRLGTAGALKNAAPFVDGPFLVLNGDSYLDLDFAALVAFHQESHAEKPRVIGTLASVEAPDVSAYGALALEDNRRIVGFQEKGRMGSGWINAGIYVLEPEFLALIPPEQVISLEKETFPQALAQGYHLLAYPAEGFFVDIGTPVGYAQFQHYMETQRDDHS